MPGPGRGVGTPLPGPSRGYPLPRSRQGVPSSRSRWGGVGVPPNWEGVPPVSEGVPPTWEGGYTTPTWEGVPLPPCLGRGYPSPPCLGRGYPPQIPGRGVPPTAQRSVYLLRCGRCASCVRAGGLFSVVISDKSRCYLITGHSL